MNVPNILTMARIVAVAGFIPCLMNGYYLAALIIFALASVTDFLDGYIARKYKLVTNLGKFLDPLADKILVISALVCFVELGLTAAWAVCIIIIREFAVTGLRLAVVSAENSKHEKKVVAAGWLGKIKTAATMVSEVYILVVLSFDIAAPTYIFDTLIYICVFFTVLSGVEYFTKYGSYLNDNNSKT